MDAQIKQLPQIEPRLPAVLPRLKNLAELATLWDVSLSWLRRQCMSTCADPLPVYRLGANVRVDPSDPALTEWLRRRHVVGAK